MKLAGDKANNYFSNPDANHTSILIYGADSMRVALRRQELLKSLIGDNAEEDEDLKDLPPKAADTAAPKAPAKK